LKDAHKFWHELTHDETVVEPPADVRALLQGALPPGYGKVTFIRRLAGVGSLGRPRATAIAHASGGYVAREAKPLLGSAWTLPSAPARADPVAAPPPQAVSGLLERSVRSPDPFLSVSPDGGWILRRLAPDCVRVTFDESERHWLADDEELLAFMG